MKQVCLWIFAFLTLPLCFFLQHKFNHPTAVGNKLSFTNCHVKTNIDGTYSEETIQILTIEHGIKIVEAETQLGAIFGLGFIHGMDRLWQLEFWRKMASGRLAEIFGDEALQLDKYVRTLGATRMIDEYIDNVDPEDLLILENYAAGVNKLVEQIHVYPLEFYLFFHDFETFTPRDSVAIQYVLTMFISSDWFFEVTRSRLLEIYDREFVDKLLPFSKEHLTKFKNDVQVISDQELERIGLLDMESQLYSMPEHLLFNSDVEKIKKIQFQNVKQNPGPIAFKYAAAVNGQGSNCWVVHGSKTETGKPILSCDPHLNKAIHQTWYLTRLSWNIKDQQSNENFRQTLVAASVVGTPTITHGRTQFAAWGLTAINPDVSDVFVEQINEYSQKYLGSNNKWHKIEQKVETIKVRFGSDYNLTTRFTRNGVLLPNDILEGSAHDLMPWVSSDIFKSETIDGVTLAYALANVFDPMVTKKFKQKHPDLSFSIIFKLTNQKNITGEEFASAIREAYNVPTNFVFALQETGDIGYITTGKFPVRKYNVVQGSYVKIGHLDDNMWAGLVPSSEKPYLVNPDKGFLVTANNFITSSHVKHGISHQFAFQHRAVRIQELLEQAIQTNKVNVELMKIIQSDVLDIQARQSLPDMIKCVMAGHRGRDLGTALSIFQDWDFQFDVESSAATLFTVWENQLGYYLHETQIGSIELRNSLQNHPAYMSAFYEQVRQWSEKKEVRESFCEIEELNEITTKNAQKNTCQEFMAHTLLKAFQDLTRRLGKYDKLKNNWRLGNYQFVRYVHNPLSTKPILNRIFEHVTEYPGNDRTNNVAVSFTNVPSWMEGQVIAGSVFRMINDLSDQTQMLMVSDVGAELTNPFTSNNRIGINKLWTNGEYISMPLQNLPETVSATIFLFPSE